VRGLRRSGDGAPDLRAWVAGQEPAVPQAFLRLVQADTHGSPERPLDQRLLAEARGALRDALQGSGERRGAYLLLLADAYLTYACQLALDSEDATASLEQAVEGVVAEAEVG
jgi:hypothetical protein